MVMRAIITDLSGVDPTAAVVQLTLQNNGATYPHVVWPEVAVSNFDLPKDELDIQINWDDSGSATQSGATNVEALWGTSLNVSDIPEGGHVFNDDLPHTVTVTVSDGTNEVVQTAVAQLVAPATPVANQIYVDTAGTLGVQHTDAPAGAHYATSLDEALTVFNTLSGEGTVYLKRGQTVTPSTSQWVGSKNLKLAAWGTGDKPIIQNNGLGRMVDTGLANGFEVAVEYIKFVGSYDPQTESGTADKGLYAPSSSDIDWKVIGCEFENVWLGIEIASNNLTSGRLGVLSGTRIFGHGEYSVLLPFPNDLFVIDCNLLSDPLGMAGGKGKASNLENRHGNIRMSNPRSGSVQVFQNSSLFHNASWTPEANASLNRRASGNGCVRWLTGQQNGANSLRVNRCYFEGPGALSLGDPNQGDAVDKAPADVIIQGVMAMITPQSKNASSPNPGSAAFKFIASGVTCKSAIVVFPDLDNVDFALTGTARTLYNQPFVVDTDTTNPSYTPTYVKILNPTYIQNGDGVRQVTGLTAADARVRSYSAAVAEVHHSQEVDYREGSGNQALRDALGSVVLTAPLTPLYAGYGDLKIPTPFDASYAIPASTNAVLTPQPGSSIATLESGQKRALRDFFGNPHNAKGAVAVPV